MPMLPTARKGKIPRRRTVLARSFGAVEAAFRRPEDGRRKSCAPERAAAGLLRCLRGRALAVTMPR